MSKACLNVRVQTKAKKAGVEKISADTYKVRVCAAPEKGAANREVIAALASFFRVPPSRVRIVKGEKSRNKKILIESG
jgi:hypothetical protein